MGESNIAALRSHLDVHALFLSHCYANIMPTFHDLWIEFNKVLCTAVSLALPNL